MAEVEVDWGFDRASSREYRSTNVLLSWKRWSAGHLLGGTTT